MSGVSPYSTEKSEPALLDGGRRSRRHARRGRHSRRHLGGNPQAPPPPLGGSKVDLNAAAGNIEGIQGGEMEGGRRKRSTAKKIANELKRVAKKAKKLTMRLMKMRRRK